MRCWTWPRTDCANRTSSKLPWARRKAFCNPNACACARAGQRYFVDVTLSVPRTASLEQAHAATEAVEKKITQIVPADVVVHVEPRAKSDENLFEAIRAIAQRRGMSVHELSAHQFDNRLFIELHLEVDEGSSLREAHHRATELEQDILKETDPPSIFVLPVLVQSDRLAPATKELSRTVQNFLNSLQSEYHELTNCHEVHVRSVELGLMPLRYGRQFAGSPKSTTSPPRSGRVNASPKFSA